MGLLAYFSKLMRQLFPKESAPAPNLDSLQLAHLEVHRLARFQAKTLAAMQQYELAELPDPSGCSVELASTAGIPKLMEKAGAIRVAGAELRNELLVRLEALRRSTSELQILKTRIEATITKVSAGGPHAAEEWARVTHRFAAEALILEEGLLAEGSDLIDAYFRNRPSDMIARDESGARDALNRIDAEIDCIVLDLSRRYETALSEVASRMAQETCESARNYVAVCFAELGRTAELDIHLTVPAFSQRDGILGTRRHRSLEKERISRPVPIIDENPVWQLFGLVFDRLKYKQVTLTEVRSKVRLSELHFFRATELKEHLEATGLHAKDFFDEAMRAAFEAFYRSVGEQLLSLTSALRQDVSRHAGDEDKARALSRIIQGFCFDLDDQERDAEALMMWMDDDRSRLASAHAR